MFRHALRRLYGFDAWHVAPFARRPYAVGLVAKLREYRYGSGHIAVEIGCGLGDILRRVPYTERIGLDAETEVVRAATFLSRWIYRDGCRFDTYSFPGPC